MNASHSHAAALRLDHGKYEVHLKAFALNDTQKNALLESVFEIIVHFVDHGFNQAAAPVDNCLRSTANRHFQTEMR